MKQETVAQALERFSDSSLSRAWYLEKYFVAAAVSLGVILTVFIWMGPWDEPAAILGSTIVLTPLLVLGPILALMTGAMVVTLGRFIGWAVVRFLHFVSRSLGNLAHGEYH